jgi:hypothetical protein
MKVYDKIKIAPAFITAAVGDKVHREGVIAPGQLLLLLRGG